MHLADNMYSPKVLATSLLASVALAQSSTASAEQTVITVFGLGGIGGGPEDADSSSEQFYASVADNVCPPPQNLPDSGVTSASPDVDMLHVAA